MDIDDHAVEVNDAYAQKSNGSAFMDRLTEEKRELASDEEDDSSSALAAAAPLGSTSGELFDFTPIWL